jgi:sodium-dependent dicarboxylate transporter 2/3/5
MSTSESGLPEWARRACLVLGPLLGVIAYLLLPSGEGGLSHAARATAGVGVLMGVWWLSEAIAIEATALAPLVLFPMTGVSSFARAAGPYANDVIFLFMGGLMLGVAMERWELHKRVALRTILTVGTRPAVLIGGVMLATAFISMWVSNTAAAVMMLPVGVSMVALVEERRGAATADGRSNFAVCLMLGIAYAATIGGIGTIIGTPPNAVLVGFVARTYGTTIGFDDWLRIGVPVMLVFLPLTWFVLTRVVFPVKTPEGYDAGAVRGVIREELSALGPWTRGQRITALVFLTASVCWVVREPVVRALGLYVMENGKAEPAVTDAGIAIAAALALFLIPAGRDRQTGRVMPLLDWPHARRIPWGVLLLFGGGLSLAEQVVATGLDKAIGAQFGVFQGVHPFVIVVAITATVVFMTEIGSNTAIATTFLPIAHSISERLGVDPFLLVVPTALAASYAFAMPMGTPPNALVFASGYLRVPQMVRAGVVLNIASIVTISVMVYLMRGWMFGGLR